MRPTVIRIVGQPWTVDWALSGVTTHPLVSGWRYGRTDQAGLAIFVREDIALGQQQDTLLHEVLHACLLTTGQEVSEAVVWALTPVLLDVLRANPELTDFLLGEPTA